MTTYSPSEKTKRRLIMAAGELFAQKGVKAVTVRAIAKKAGENFGIIVYHFGGKDGLFEAVIDYATHPWTSDPLGRCLEENERLLESTEGQENLVCELIALWFEIIFAKDLPAWCSMLMFQILQRNLPTSKKIFDLVVVPIINAFSTVYRRITGDEDPENALCWVVMLLAPTQLLAVDPSTIKKIHKNKTSPDSFLLKLRDRTVRSALLNLRAQKMEQGSTSFRTGTV